MHGSYQPKPRQVSPPLGCCLILIRSSTPTQRHYYMRKFTIDKVQYCTTKAIIHPPIQCLSPSRQYESSSPLLLLPCLPARANTSRTLLPPRSEKNKQPLTAKSQSLLPHRGMTVTKRSPSCTWSTIEHGVKTRSFEKSKSF